MKNSRSDVLDAGLAPASLLESVKNQMEDLHHLALLRGCQHRSDPPHLHVQGGLSPATSEMNLYGFNSRSTSPVGIPTPTLATNRPRFSAYDSLLKRRTEVNNPVRMKTIKSPAYYIMMYIYMMYMMYLKQSCFCRWCPPTTACALPL